MRGGCLLVALVAAGAFGAEVVESARRIPVAASVDVVVAGGGMAGVSAALEAASKGRTVMVLAPRLYLGEDLADTMRLWLEEGEKPTGVLSERIWSKPGPAAPIRLKKVLEDALTKAGVRFLLGTTATDLLLDAAGKPAGLVMANRAGRQAVIAKVVVDATSGASVARLAGARFHPAGGGEVEVRRVVMGGKPAHDELIARRIPVPDEKQTLYEYRLRLDVSDPGRLEQEARDKTYREGQVRASARVSYVAPNGIIGRRAAAQWKGIAAGHFAPRGVDRLYVTERADVPANVQEQLTRATMAEAVGKAIGAEAARVAAATPVPKNVRVAGPPVRAAERAGEIREVLNGVRSSIAATEFVDSPERAVPVLGKWDVVIIGGGTSGAAAAIGAGRRGAKVLVAEFQEGLGGTGTVGLIGKPYHGRNAGFAREVPFPSETFTVDDKMEWYRKEIRKTGGEILFGVMGAGAVRDGNRVRGAVIVTPQQRGVALAPVVIDATGNADIAVAAGAEAMWSADATDLAMQGSGLPARKPGSSYVNTDYLLVDENDMMDVWGALVGARQAMADTAWDAGSLIQTRERRRMVGEHTMSYLDQLAGRTYPDSIVFSASDYDSHGYPSEDFFALLPHDKNSRLLNHPAPGGSTYTPYRCLLPKGMEGMLVTGLGISMHRDASAMVRMQRDMANQGYAAGVAAADTAKSGKPLRDLDVRALQKHLVEIGSLPEAVLQHQDSFPLPEREIRKAVQNVGYATNPEEAGVWLAMILTHREMARPLLKQRFAAAPARQKLMYANLLAFFGEKEVTPFLAKALDDIKEWDARILQGKMAEYAHLPTPIDTLILGLGRTGDPAALPALLRKLDTLDATVTLSHHRSMAIALEQLADRSAAEPLARLLNKPGMRGHIMKTVEPLEDANMDARRRIGPLREIVLARALYRCGDYNGLGAAILQEYRQDIRGLFARHAGAVLSQAKPLVR
ncbi:MAG: FAD-dependent oxidoreductase [Acidobacteria bacterium]|nr:FAD-dependent oxidoreductase [Acidobacteriota bacterium]